MATLIYDRNGSKIYDISGGWVKKVLDKQMAEELKIAVRVFDAKPRSSVLIREIGYDWYVMRRYDGTIQPGPFARSTWRQLAVQMLAFLEDFHHNVGLAHLDIKKGNVLVDLSNRTFHVGDFGNAERPTEAARSLSSFDDNTKWYYVAMGCELTEPHVSWRADFVALGYMLASLQLNEDIWQFEAECWKKRVMDGVLSDEALMELRRKEISRIYALEPYFARLVIVPWTAVEPPSRSFYQELAKLFLW
jgi:serine/threonine protein kinase